MTPLEYAKRYWEMDVPLADGPVRVCVNRYLSGCHSSPLLAKAQTLVDQVGESLTVRVRTIFGHLDERTYDKTSRKVLSGVLKDPFNGKGSPEEVQALLQVAVQCGFLKPTQLSTFCSSGKIGLDCCGFVANYIWHAVMRRPWDVDMGKKDLAASNYIPAMMQAGRAIKTEADFTSLRSQSLVLATADSTGKVIPNGPGAHVMITEPNTLIRMGGQSFIANPKGKSTIQHEGQSIAGRQKQIKEDVTFIVVESTGGGKGLVSSRYRLLSVDEKTGLFCVKRGCSNGTLNVRFATIAG